MNKPQFVLFDLDGTLVDSARDLHRAANVLLRRRDLDEISYDDFRPVVSHGSFAMIKKAFGFGIDDPRFEPLRLEFLEAYAADISAESSLFDGVEEVLTTLERNGQPWGIVTNKPEHLTWPLLDALGLTQRCASVVAGDTTTERKPHPLPIFHACEQMAVKPENGLYVGDAERDIQAAKAANMPSVAALYGYIEASEKPAEWQADTSISSADELLSLI